MVSKSVDNDTIHRPLPLSRHNAVATSLLEPIDLNHILYYMQPTALKSHGTGYIGLMYRPLLILLWVSFFCTCIAASIIPCLNLFRRTVSLTVIYTQFNSIIQLLPDFDDIRVPPIASTFWT